MGGSWLIFLAKVSECPPACAKGEISGSTEKDIVSAVGGKGGIWSFVIPRRVPSKTKVSRLCAEGVAAFKPCGRNMFLTGSRAAGGKSEAEEEFMAERCSEGGTG